MNKKAQLSYEYLILIGMLLVLLIPFFYTFSLGMTGGLSEQMNEDAVTRIAHGAETIANLGAATSSLIVPVQLSTESSTISGTSSITLVSRKGEPYSATVAGANIYSGVNAVAGKGFYVMPVVHTLRKNSIVIGAEPAIVALCRPAKVHHTEIGSASSPHCEDVGKGTLAVRPKEDVMLVGANFDSLTVVGIEKVDKKGQENLCDTPEGCQYDYQCDPIGKDSQYGHCFAKTCSCATSAASIIDPLEVDLLPGKEKFVLYLDQSKTGKGTYDIGVSTDFGRSQTVTVEFDSHVDK